MGVTGLWRLIEPVGKPVPVETLENKVLAVDISIWLHQMVKGYQDAKGAPLPNAHLMGLFQRVCKLLYFRIKPVFVFDGAFPDLKKETIGKRQDSKAKYNSESERIKREIALLLGKKTAIGALLGKQIPQKKTALEEDKDNIFKLPALPHKEEESESESEEERYSSSSSVDLHSVNLDSEEFKKMPSKEKYDLLVELKETRKMNSWGKLHTLPKQSDNFSDFQMQRLLKRRKVQECLQETEKEIGEGGMSLNDLESLLNEEGIDTKFESLPNRRIASNNTTRYLLISSVKQALADAKKKKEMEESKQTEAIQTEKVDQNIVEEAKTDELEDDLQKAIKMSLECVDDSHDTSAGTSKTDESWTSNLSNSDYSDTEDSDGYEQPDMSSAKAYIMQYSDFTHETIEKIVVSREKDKRKQKDSKVDKILEELDKETSVIVDKMDISSTDEVLSDSAISSNETDTTKAQYILQQRNEVNDSLQASVICVDDNNKEIISLDTSTDEENIQIKCPNTRDNTNENKVSLEEKLQNYTYNSPCPSAIKLCADSKVSVAESTNALRSEQILKESDSSDDDFEEVTPNDNFVKPVVQLNLNVNEEIQDDIFADIFDQNNVNREKILSSPSKSELNYDEANTTKYETEANTRECGQLTTLKPTLTVLSKTKTQISDMNTNSNKDDNIAIETVDTQVTSTDVSNKNESTNTNADNNEKISEEHLNTIVLETENKEQDLLQEKGRLDRIGRNITEQMTKEAQELLQLFGIPYIVAPMEAEAQCAFLESVNLTDGTITDDSDIWLFGGKTVYKNFFNQKKHVLQYLSERIEKSFNLSREQLVLLALLVGSDYTTGVNGIGPVTALEVLASFPFNKKLLNTTSKQARYQEIVNGLIDFKKWVRAGKRTDNVSLKKKLRNVKVADDFPSVRVVQAYLDPNVEKSKENFTWGQLDITLLRDYTKAKFGWSQNKLDEIIKPVLKRIQDKKSQKSVHDYFKRKTDFHSLEDQMSKRVKAAVQKMDPNSDNRDMDINKERPKTIRKRKQPIEKPLEDSQINKESGPSKSKEINIKEVLKVCPVSDNIEKFDIKVRRTQTSQEIIPQRERDKQNILQNKLKAIEAFRKSKIDCNRKKTKRKLPKPKDDANLSESSDSN